MLGRDTTCRATSAEAGLKPKPVGAFSSSSTPLTPGLKWSSTWKRSSEVRSCRGSKGAVTFFIMLYAFFIICSYYLFVTFCLKTSALPEQNALKHKSGQALDDMFLVLSVISDILVGVLNILWLNTMYQVLKNLRLSLQSRGVTALKLRHKQP